MEQFKSKISNLSLVIALDNSSEKVCSQVKAILSNQGVNLRFYKLILTEEVIKLVSVGDAFSPTQDDQIKSTAEAKVNFSKVVKSLNDLTAQIEQSITELYSHSRLLSEGIALTSPIPLDVILVGDLKDPACDQIILSIILILNDIVSRYPEGCLHLLLDIAAFDDDKKIDLDMQVYSKFLELNELLKRDSPSRSKLSGSLNITDRHLDKCFPYVFHNQKPNGVQVSSSQLMKTMVGNALMTMLIGDTVRKFAFEASSCRRIPAQSDYSGIGSVLVSYDPVSLMDYCRNRSIQHTIDNILLIDGSDATIKSLTDNADTFLTDSKTWISDMLQVFPDEVSAVIKSESGDLYNVSLKTVSLGHIDYSDFHNSKNYELINNARLKLDSGLIQKWDQSINGVRIDLLKKIKSEVNEFCNALPQNIKSYPGGLDNAIRTMNYLKVTLLEEEQRLEDLKIDFDASTKKSLETIDQTSEKLKRIIDEGPKQPGKLPLMPKNIYALYSAFYYHLRYFLPLLEYKRILEELPVSLEQYVGYQIQYAVTNAALQLVKDLKDHFDLCDNQLRALQELIKGIKNNYPGLDPVGEDKNAWTPFFRISAINNELAITLFNELQEKDQTIINNLIHKEKLFVDCFENHTNIEKILTDYHEKMFSALARMSLYDIHSHYQKHIDLKSPLTKPDILAYLNASLPLIDPKTDTGTMDRARRSGYYFIGASSWSEINIAEEIANGLKGWEVISTDDPYAIAASQVWHSIPFEGFAHIFDDEKIKLDRKKKQEKEQSVDVDDDNYVKTINENDQIIEKEFQWQFSPKGSKKEYTYNLKLFFDKTRYKRYCEMARNIPLQQYNLYAQEDMPEINDLVLEFQKIFSQHKNWSTLSKSQCILKFVQTAVTYHYDIDSKGQSEWPRYPIETLLEGKGDCEDVAILCAAILVRLGLDVVLLYYVRDEKTAHMAFGVAGSSKLKGNYIKDPSTGKNYYYGEATAKGWVLGEIPDDYQKPPEKIIYVELLMDDEDSA